jgi:hypothetical protein
MCWLVLVAQNFFRAAKFSDFTAQSLLWRRPENNLAEE